MKDLIDRLISEFKLKEARQMLTGLRISDIPPGERSDYAALCRRAGLYRLSLQFVHELVHETKQATQKDLLEYASCLRRIGLLNEALRTLGRMPPSPQHSLQKAFCHIHRWDYQAAAGHLLQVLEGNPNAVTSRTARLNLAACLVVLGEYEQATRWLADLEPECRRDSLHHLMYCHEVRAQIHLYFGEYGRAREVLSEAAKGSALDGTARLLLQKWVHVLNVAEFGMAKARPDLEAFKAQIRDAGHWESLRSLDWEIARITQDPELAARVYFGTPFPAFRNQILASDAGSRLPDHIVRTDARWQGAEAKLINGLTGQNMPFKFGSIPYRTALLMLSDNYQPWTVFRLFDGLFGDEAFDPFHSPNRIYQIVDRIRNEIARKNIPLEIRTSGQGFRLRPRDEGAVIVFDEMRFLSVEAMILHLLKLRFRNTEFKLKDLKGLTPLSPTQTQRAIRALVEESALQTLSGKQKVRRFRVKAS